MLSAPPVDDLWNTDQAEKAAEEAENGLKKYSVTALLQNARNRVFLEDEEQTPEEKRTPDYVERAMKRYQAGSRPAFMDPAKEAGGAARGTVIHRFLSLVDLDAVRERGGADAGLLSAMLDRLAAEQVFTPEEAAWIRPERRSAALRAAISSAWMRACSARRAGRSQWGGAAVRSVCGRGGSCWAIRS